MKTRWLIVLFVLALLFATYSIALWLIDPPPMTGVVTDKDCHPAYYPVDERTQEIYVLAITNGNKCTSWVVSKERYELYEIDDPVEWLPRMKKEGL